MVDISEFYGLAYGCPLCNRKTDCFFHSIDHLSFRKKLLCINELDQEEKRSILEHHIECSNNRNNSK